MNEETRRKLFEERLKRNVFYPQKTLVLHEIGPFTIMLWCDARLEGDPKVWKVSVKRYSSEIIVMRAFSTLVEAQRAFSQAKDKAIVDTACEAMGIQM